MDGIRPTLDDGSLTPRGIGVVSQLRRLACQRGEQSESE